MRLSGTEDGFNGEGLLAERWSLLATAIEKLAGVRTLDAVTDVVRLYARRIAGADGIAIILREGDSCHYVAEDSDSPLWAGQRFPAESCISGIAMIERQPVVIPDVMADPRVPHAAYASTFVRSMVMMPIGLPKPVAAVGAYWSETGTPSSTAVTLLQALARAASTALENGRLFGALEELNAVLDARVAERTAELERSQEIVRQAQKMETIGHLTGNVAHDFNNLLTPIMGGLDLVQAGRPFDDRMRRAVGLAMDAAERAKLLVERLLAFARRQPLAPGPVDLADLMARVRDLIATSLGSRIALTIDIEPGLPRVRGDRHQLEMALLNLAVNARDAMPDGGTLSITIGREGDRQWPDAPEAGKAVFFTVRDSGTGMDSATLARAVEPFFSTKDAGHGTGLGLSMVDGLIGQLGGALRLESEKGLGTAVSFWLPVMRAPAAMVRPFTDPPSRTDEAGLVLVIDDESIVRAATAEMLGSLGYEVVQAANAREALDLLLGGLDPVIVITDHIMPGMTGAELALQLRRDRPDLPVMIISGYQGLDLIAPDIVRLAKPFRQKFLSASIARAREQVIV